MPPFMHLTDGLGLFGNTNCPTLAKLGIPKTTFYRRYDRYLAFGRVWFYLSTILDDYSRYIIAWKLCTTMKTKDVTDTLKLALQASGFDRAKVMHKPRLLRAITARPISPAT